LRRGIRDLIEPLHTLLRIAKDSKGAEPISQRIKHAEHAEEDIIRRNDCDRAGPPLFLVNLLSLPGQLADLICGNVRRRARAVKYLVVGGGLRAQFRVYMGAQLGVGD
jgi:hypothetical protein